MISKLIFRTLYNINLTRANQRGFILVIYDKGVGEIALMKGFFHL